MDIVEALQMMRADPNVCVELGDHPGIYKLIDGELRYWGRNAWVESHISLNCLLTHRFKVVPDPSIKPMSFIEAVRECNNGKTVRRAAWIGRVARIKDGHIIDFLFSQEDVLATDWEVVE